MTRTGWSQLEFVMTKQGGRPERRLQISEHQEHGVGVVIFSISWDETYHFYTGRPVTEKEALRHVKRYLSDTNNGQRYIGR